jgi:hypothetical protein
MPEAKSRLKGGETGRLPVAADAGKQHLSRPIPLAGIAGTIGNVSVTAEFHLLLAWGPEAGPEAPDRVAALDSITGGPNRPAR